MNLGLTKICCDDTIIINCSKNRFYEYLTISENLKTIFEDITEKEPFNLLKELKLHENSITSNIFKEKSVIKYRKEKNLSIDNLAVVIEQLSSLDTDDRFCEINFVSYNKYTFNIKIFQDDKENIFGSLIFISLKQIRKEEENKLIKNDLNINKINEKNIVEELSSNFEEYPSCK
jgi:hypothetical protein